LHFSKEVIKVRKNLEVFRVVVLWHCGNWIFQTLQQPTNPFCITPSSLIQSSGWHLRRSNIRTFSHELQWRFNSISQCRKKCFHWFRVGDLESLFERFTVTMWRRPLIAFTCDELFSMSKTMRSAYGILHSFYISLLSIRSTSPKTYRKTRWQIGIRTKPTKPQRICYEHCMNFEKVRTLKKH